MALSYLTAPNAGQVVSVECCKIIIITGLFLAHSQLVHRREFYPFAGVSSTSLQVAPRITCDTTVSSIAILLVFELDGPLFKGGAIDDELR